MAGLEEPVVIEAKHLQEVGGGEARAQRPPARRAPAPAASNRQPRIASPIATAAPRRPRRPPTAGGAPALSCRRRLTAACHWAASQVLARLTDRRIAVEKELSALGEAKKGANDIFRHCRGFERAYSIMLQVRANRARRSRPPLAAAACDPQHSA